MGGTLSPHFLNTNTLDKQTLMTIFMVVTKFILTNNATATTITALIASTTMMATSPALHS
jgi:hypothetical protein